MDEVASLVIKVLSEQVDTATRRLEQLERQSNETERATKKLGAVNFSAVAGQLAAFGVGVGALGFAAKKAAADWIEFDTAIKKVGSVASFTGKELKTLRKETLALSSALGVDATASAEGLYEALQADIPKENLVSFLSTATKTAVGGVTDVKSAVNSLTNVINSYGMDVGRADEISDKLFATVLYGKASFDQLGSSLAGATVPAAAMGVSLEEVLAMIAQITSLGTGTSEAVTQVARSIQALQDPSAEMLAVFRQMEVADGRAAIAKRGLVGTLEEVRKAYTGNDAAIIKATGSVIALAALQGTTGTKLQATADKLDKVTNSAGNNEKAFKANSDTVGSSINSIKSSVTLLVEEMENSFGVIAKFSDSLRGIAALMVQASSSSFTPDTKNAISLGGQLGVTTTLNQLDSLAAKQKELIALGADASKATDAYRKANFGYLPELFTNSGARNAELAQTNKEIAALQDNLNNLADTDKAFGQINYEVNKLTAEQKKATDPVAIEGYKLRIEALRGEYGLLESEIAGAAKAEEDKATATKKSTDEADKRAAEQLALAEKEAALAAEAKKTAIGTAKYALDLSTTEIEKLREKQADIRKGITLKKEEGGIDAEVGAKALANIDEQIKLLEKRDAKTGGGGGGGGAVGQIDAALDLPDLADPYGPKDAYAALREQEMAVADSYAKRREAILTNTKLTEDQRLALLADAQDKYKAIMAQADEARFQTSIKLASDTFGQLSDIAGAFGKKGAGMAKGFAVAQATVDMIGAAQAAYKATAGIAVVGPYLAPVAAAGALAVGAANVARIKSTDYAGAYEHGGMIPAGKTGLVGEAGAEFVQGPAVVTSARTTDSLLNRSENSTPRTEVKIYNYSGQPVEEKRTTQGDVEMVEIIVGRAAERVADDIHKGGNRISGAIEKKYNLTRGKA